MPHASSLIRRRRQLLIRCFVLVGITVTVSVAVVISEALDVARIDDASE